MREKIILIPLLLAIMASVGLADVNIDSLYSCELTGYINEITAYSFVDGLNNSYTADGNWTISPDVFLNNQTILDKISYEPGETIETIVKYQKSLDRAEAIIIQQENGFYRAILQYSKSDKTIHHIIELRNLELIRGADDSFDVLKSSTTNFAMGGYMNFNYSLLWKKNTTVFVIDDLGYQSSNDRFSNVRFLILGAENETHGIVGLTDGYPHTYSVDVYGHTGLITISDAYNTKPYTIWVQITKYDASTYKLDLFKVNVDTSLADNTKEYNACGSYNVVFKSTAGNPCGKGAAMTSRCDIYNEKGEYIASTEATTDQTQTVTQRIPISYNVLTDALKTAMIYGDTNSMYGWLRPTGTCWAEEYVGYDKIDHIQYNIFTDEDVQEEAFAPIMQLVNDKYSGIIQWHYFKGVEDTQYGINYPAIVSGHYAMPLVIDASTDYDLTGANLEWNYLMKAYPQYFFNDISSLTSMNTFGPDMTNIFEDNKVFLALAYNSTHYVLDTFQYNTTTGLLMVIGSQYLNWTDLRSQLISYGVNATGIDDFDNAFSMQNPYSASGGKIRLKGYVWFSIDNNLDDLGYNTNMIRPNCLQGIASGMQVIPCDSNLIQYPPYENENNFCEAPKDAVRYFYFLSPNIEIIPHITAEVTINNYATGTLTLPAGKYSYSCTSTEVKGNPTGNFTVLGNTEVKVLFSAEEEGTVILNITVVDKFKNIVSGVYVKTKYGTKQTDNKGQVTFNVEPNQLLNVNLSYSLLNREIIYNLPIGDYWNCEDLSHEYDYVLSLAPSTKKADITVTCGSIGMPNMNVFVNGLKYGMTDENGKISFNYYGGELINYDNPFNVSVENYKYPTEWQVTPNIDSYNFRYSNCSETDFIGGLAGQKIDWLDIMGKVVSPLFIAFLILIGLSIAVWLATASIELTGVALVGGALTLSFIGLMPAYITIIIISVLALVMANKVMGWF